MTDISPADLRSRIASEFDRRGWPYEPGFGDLLLGGLEREGAVDPAVLAQRLPAAYLDRNGISRDQVIAALSDLGGLTMVPMSSTQTLVVNDNRYQVVLSDQSQIVGSNVNLGGSQINVSVEAPKEEVLTALRLLVAAAFAGDWNDAAVGELSRLVDGRSDISVEEISMITKEIGSDQEVPAGRVQEMLDKVATGTLTGVLSTGLSAGLGHLLASLPL